MRTVGCRSTSFLPSLHCHRIRRSEPPRRSPLAAASLWHSAKMAALAFSSSGLRGVFLLVGSSCMFPPLVIRCRCSQRLLRLLGLPARVVAIKVVGHRLQGMIASQIGFLEIGA